ncbi:MAG: endolytic transglycosylase MltG [Deltaproteobacteria bacterium]|nr:endolytic transglycosylase MltG [Deltaproteobacteria bacterium]
MTENAPLDRQTPSPEPAGRKSGMAKKILLTLLLAVFAVAGYCAYDGYTFLTTPASPEPRDVTIDILPGATFDRVAWDLYKAGALKDVFRFRLLAKITKKLGAVQAGEFTVNTGWTPMQMLGHLTSGRANLYRLALREGLPWWEVARLVEEGGFAKASEFEAVIHNPEFLRQYGIPFANAEGFLYPETYLLRKPKELGGRAQAEIVARMLVEMFWKRSWSALSQFAATDAGPKGTPVYLPNFALKNGVPVRTPPQAPPAAGDGTRLRLPITPPLPAPVSLENLRYLVILASLVEKETSLGEERARVAGVYANRMRIGMLLQCDPTIIYGLGKNQSGPIRRSQLEDEKNPYNTYKHPGLPPGPICSPGAASIRAAVSPESHQYLYFVATGKPDGTHTFSVNLRDHEKAVRIYRAAQGR